MGTGDMSQLSDKAILRNRVLAARRAISAERRADADRSLIDQVVGLLRRWAVATVAAYAPMPGEPGGPDLLDTLAERTDRVLVPALLPDNDLDWAAYAGPESLTAARFRQPTGARLGPDAIAGADLVIVPALAVDRRRMRLGRGGGSYDRALARVDHSVPVIALLYDGEIVDHVPTRPHDRPVTAALTPTPHA
jgi:5-formyltetrahydrofolate cyclo-ligase